MANLRIANLPASPRRDNTSNLFIANVIRANGVLPKHIEKTLAERINQPEYKIELPSTNSLPIDTAYFHVAGLVEFLDYKHTIDVETTYTLKVVPHEDTNSAIVITGMPDGASIYAGVGRYEKVVNGTVSVTPTSDKVGIVFLPDGSKVRVLNLVPGISRWGLGIETHSDGIELNESYRLTPIVEIMAVDEVSFTESVKSKIPVLDWQDGYSYYNNYSSKKPDESTGKFEQVETTLVREVYEVVKSKLIERKERVDFSEKIVHVGGIRSKFAEDYFEVQDRSTGRNGLWSFELRETISHEESYRRSGTWVVTPRTYNYSSGLWEYDYTRALFRDTFTVQDSGRAGIKFGYERIGVEETYRKNGRTVIGPLTDYVGLEEKRYGHSSLRREDEITLHEKYYISGRRVRLSTEQVSVSEEIVSLHGRKVVTRSDTVNVVDTGLPISGKRAFYFKETIGVVEEAPPFLRTVRDDLLVDDSTYEQDGLRNWYFRDDISVSERLVNDTPVQRETFNLQESYWQNGRRVWEQKDSNIRVYDSGYMETGSPRRRDDFYVQDSFYQRNGIVALGKYTDTVQVQDKRDKLQVYKDATRYDQVVYSERYELHGKIQKRASDTVSMVDSKFFNIITEREDITVSDYYTPFRFDWRENISMKPEWYRTDKYKDYSVSERIEARDRGALFDKFLVEIVESEDVKIFESFIAGGITAKYGRDDYSLRDNSFKPINNTPLRRDSVSLVESVKRNGRLVIETVPSEEVLVSESYEVHGRRRFKAYDGAYMTETRNNPKSPNMREDIYVRDGYVFVPTQTEYVLMKETFFKEDIRQNIKVIETYYLANRHHVKRENYSMRESYTIRSGLNLGDRYRVKDSRFLERYMEVPKLEQVQVTDKYKLFRKSDFLDINPIIYRDRPGRLRSSARLSVNPVDGQLYAVWADKLTNTVQYAMKPARDSWRGHKRNTFELPKNMYLDKKSVALLFRPDGGIAPMIELNGHIMLWDLEENTWKDLGEGRDVATHPLTGEYVFLSPSRTLVKIGGHTSEIVSTEMELSTRGRIVQAYSGNDPGLYVVDDMNRFIKTIGTPPFKQSEPTEEVPSARWDVLYEGETYSRGWIPIEGVITEGRI